MTLAPKALVLAAALALSAAPPLAPPALAAAPAALSADSQALVGKASAYLQGLNQARGRFVQTDPRGRISQGAFFLNRPGRIRFEYAAPSNLLVVADGHMVNVLDPRLKSFNAYPIGFTPLHLFLAKSVSLEKSALIDQVQRTGDGFTVTARDRAHPRDGSITLVFSGSPMRLKEWTIVDARGQRTKVELIELQGASGLDAKLFELRNPYRPAPRPLRGGA